MDVIESLMIQNTESCPCVVCCPAAVIFSLSNLALITANKNINKNKSNIKKQHQKRNMIRQSILKL